MVTEFVHWPGDVDRLEPLRSVASVGCEEAGLYMLSDLGRHMSHPLAAIAGFRHGCVTRIVHPEKLEYANVLHIGN